MSSQAGRERSGGVAGVYCVLTSSAALVGSRLSFRVHPQSYSCAIQFVQRWWQQIRRVCSTWSFGGTLEQHFVDVWLYDWLWYPIALTSSTLLQLEQCYTTRGWECLTVTNCLTEWWHTLLGAPFHVWSDHHQSLKWLQSNADPECHQPLMLVTSLDWILQPARFHTEIFTRWREIGECATWLSFTESHCQPQWFVWYPQKWSKAVISLVLAVLLHDESAIESGASTPGCCTWPGSL